MRLAEVKLGQDTAPQDSSRRGPVQVIAVTSGQGGAGKTSIAINLGQAFARGGRSTMLLDADLGPANIDSLLGITPGETLLDVANGNCQIEDVIIPVADDLQFIPAAAGTEQLAQLGCREYTGLVRAFSDLERPLDVLIVDTTSCISDCVASFCRAANEVLVVVCNDRASIRDSVTRIEMLSAGFGVDRFRILANKVDGAREGEQMFQEILAGLADDHRQVLYYAGFIPRDTRMIQAVAERTSVISSFPRSRAAMAIANLARQINTWPQPVHAGGHVEFFVERLIQKENNTVEVSS